MSNTATLPSNARPGVAQRVLEFLNPEDEMVHLRRTAHISNGILWLSLAATLVVVSLTWYLFLSSRGYIDYVEGLVLFHQSLAANGENIYDIKFRQMPPYSISPYGHVFNYLLAPAVAAFPSLLPGRIVSSLCLALISGLSWRVLRKRFDATALVAAVGTLPWLAMIGVLQFGVNNRVDVLAMALGVGALFTICSERPKIWLWSIPLLVLAGFTRSTAAIGPGVAIFVMLLFERRIARAVTIAAAVISSAVVILIAGDLNSDGNFTKSVIFSNGSTPVTLDNAKRLTVAACTQTLLPAGILAALLLLGDARTRIFGLHAVVSFAIAAVTVGKIGSNLNYFLEPSWAAGLCLAILLTKIPDRPLVRCVASVATCAVVMQSMIYAVPYARGFHHGMSQFPGIYSLIEKYGNQGPLLTMESGAQVLAGQQVYLADMHIFTRLNEAGKFDLKPVIEDVRRQHFRAVIARDDIVFDAQGYSNWTPEMRLAVAAYYRPAEECCGVTVFVPRDQPIPESSFRRDEPKRSAVTKFHANGRRAIEMQVVNDERHGVEREWDSAGVLLRETNYEHGRKHGDETY